MKIFRWSVIFLCMTLEVRLKAAEQEPKDCLSHLNVACSLFSSQITEINTSQFKFNLSAGSILFRNQKNEWNFVSGTIRILNKTKMKLQTRTGELKLSPGLHWIQWRDEKLWVFVLKGNAQIDLLSSLIKENYIPEGFVNWFGLINYQQKNQQGVPRMITLSMVEEGLPGFTRYGDHHIIKKKESRTIAVASDLYRDLAQSMENQARDREAAMARRAALKAEHEKRILQQFRSKYLGPVDLDD